VKSENAKDYLDCLLSDENDSGGWLVQIPAGPTHQDFLMLAPCAIIGTSERQAMRRILVIASFSTFIGVLLWWSEYGISFSPECKAAREQHAKLKVDSSLYARLYRESRYMEIEAASRQIDKYCNKPPSI
jgi:hypothetical protein